MTASSQHVVDYLNEHGADVTYICGFLDPFEAEHFLHALLAEVEFNRPEDSRVFVHGKWLLIPRRQSGYGDPGTSYRFAGCTVSARPWAAAPSLARMREILHQRAGYEANFVLLNHYRHGADSIGWHQDDEADLGPAPQILSVSLGAVRDFQFRRRDAATSGVRTVSLALEAGSLLVMRDPTN